MAPLDTAEKMEAKAGEGSKENQDPLPHLPVLSSEPPAVVTTPSATVWTTRMARLSSMAMARCFSDILGDQRISVLRLPAERHTRHLLLRGR